MKSLLVLLLTCVGMSAATDCSTSEISCANNEKCIPHRYICDSDDDCGDKSDEDQDLCNAWKNDRCDRNFVECTRNGETNCIEIAEFCKPPADNQECEGDLDRRICLMLDGGRIGKLDNFTLAPVATEGNLNKSNELAIRFRNLMQNTISHDSCPDLHTLVDDQCISFFYIGSMSWGEGRQFCKSIGSDLITFKNVSQFASIVQHLQKNELQSDFWIGGSLSDPSVGWTWVDNSPMEMGTPFWTTRYSATCSNRNVTAAKTEQPCYHYYQSPEAVPRGECASLSFEHSFYIADEDCLKKKAPLCVYQGLDFPKRPKF